MSAVVAEDHMGDSVAQLEPRVAKVEAGVEYIVSRVSNIEIDLRDMRKSMDQRFQGVGAEFNAVRAEMREEFETVRAEMRGEFKTFRAEMREEFTAARAETSAGFRALRADFKQESDRVTRLQLITVIMGIEVLLVTKGSQMFQALWAWLSHFR
jgi:hypothetical protein